MRRLSSSLLGLAATALALGGCDLGTSGRVLAIDAEGSVASVIFWDQDGDTQHNPAIDAAARGIRISLVRGGRDTVASAVSDSAGRALLKGIPVGSYRIVIDPTSLGDSAQVVRADSTPVTVSREDTAVSVIGLGFPPVSIAEARSRRGRVLSVRGVALHGWATFGDSTLHVADSSGAIRALAVPAASVQVGDSIQLLGRVEERDGRPALLGRRVLVRGRGQEPSPEPVNTQTARQAGEGRLDAATVRVSDAAIIDAERLASGDVQLRVDDGSGVLNVVLDRHAGITSEEPVLPGARVDVTGVLVPNPSGEWTLKPRGTADLTVRFPPVTIAEAKRQVGRVVAVHAIALNAWTTFGDGTLHVVDSSGALRAVQVNQAFVERGDSIRLLGWVVIRDGQPTLTGASASVLAKNRPMPAPSEVNTSTAAAADEGRLDAALVRVFRAVVEDTARAQNDFVLTVNDGSGPLTVVLDRDTGIGRGSVPVGSVRDITGLLVPMPGGGGWLLKPRDPGDIVP